jgi:hypothetical protein
VSRPTVPAARVGPLAARRRVWPGGCVCGGAVNALALVARHPEQVRTPVAHEPPAARELPDAGAAMAVTHGIRQTYLSSGFGPAMARFTGTGPGDRVQAGYRVTCRAV